MNLKNEIVSVIIITYNSSRYILETLESVKNQTYDNIELIVTDDCSKDNTVDLCTNWINKNKDRFTNALIITTPHNTGTSANSNRGIKASKGKWLKTISGDDILLNNCITDNMNYAKLLPDNSFIISDLSEIDEYGNVIRKRHVNDGLIYFSKLSSAKKQLKAYSRWPVFLNIPTIFGKKENIEKINFCDEDFRIFEDMTIVHRLMEMDIKFHFMNKPTVAYRIHDQAVSRNIKMDILREKELFIFFKKYQMKHLHLWNPLDLSVCYEYWLRFKYKGTRKLKGSSVLRKLSLFYWYMKFNGVKSY